MSRQYSESFKAEAVKLALGGRASKARIAKELGVNINSLDAWIRKYKESLGEIDPRKKESLEDEVKRLRKENDLLREERDILKKAVAYFARERQ